MTQQPGIILARLGLQKQETISKILRKISIKKKKLVRICIALSLYIYFQSNTCTISIPELIINSTENYISNTRSKKNRSLDILNDAFPRTSSIPFDKNSNTGNIDSDKDRIGGNLTNIEGIMDDIEKHIKKIKNIKAGKLTKHIGIGSRLNVV